MTRKKKGFFTFCFSFIPGAGEMYMGFFKEGISIMTLFLAIVSLAGFFNISPLVLLSLVVWCYSFFHVHNLASLSDEEFYALEDKYLFINNVDGIENIFLGEKGRKIMAVILIVIGCSAAWNVIVDIIADILYSLNINTNLFYGVTRAVPQTVISILLICLGIYLIKGKSKEINEKAYPYVDKIADDEEDKDKMEEK